MELNCKVIEVLPVQSGTSSKGDWEKHAFVVSWMDGQYEQKLCLEVMGADKFDKMKNAVVVGHEVLVKFNVTSRAFQNRWFTTANCFYCATVGGAQMQNNANTQAQAPQQQNNDAHVDDSGLPF